MVIHKNVMSLDSFQNKKDKLIDKIRNGKSAGLCYLITLPPNKHQLEMFRYVLDKQACFNTDKYILVGIAPNYEDGIMLIEQISIKVYETSGDLDFKKYFKD